MPTFPLQAVCLQILEKENTVARLHQQASGSILQEEEARAGVQERCLGIGWEFAMFLLLKLRGKPPVQRPELGCRASPYNIGRPHPHTELVGLACKYRHRNTHKYKYKTNLNFFHRNTHKHKTKYKYKYNINGPHS